MSRRRLSQLLATLLGGGPSMLLAAALDPRCDGSVFKGELVPIKGELNGIKVNINVGGSNGEAAEPPPHQQSGAPAGQGEGTLPDYCRPEGAGYVCDTGGR